MPASTDFVALRSAAEGTWGTPPGGTYLDKRYTSDTMEQRTTTVESAELDSSRNTTSSARTDVIASGEVGVEYSYGAHDDWMQAALYSAAWAGGATATESITFATPANTLTRAAGSWITDTFAVGQWVEVRGSTSNDGFYKITNVAATVLTVEAAHTIVAEGPTPSVTVEQGAQVVNGNTLQSFTLEREYTDLSNIFVQYPGARVDSMQMALGIGSIVTGSFGFTAKQELSQTATDSSAITPATSGVIFNSVDHVNLQRGFSPFTIRQWSMNMQNNTRSQSVVGTLGATGVGVGKCRITGTIQAYFESHALFTDYLAFASSPLAVALNGNGVGAYLLELPQPRLTAGARPTPGINQDVIANMEYTVEKDATLGGMIRLSRFSG
jgi:hypothetical protein